MCNPAEFFPKSVCSGRVFSVMDSTVAIQMKRFRVCIPSRQIFFNGSNEIIDTDEGATTYAFSVSSPNQRSIKFSQLELVGM